MRRGPVAERGTSDDDLRRDEPVEIANEFAVVRVRKVYTKSGERLEIESPKRGRLIRLDPLELEAIACVDDESFLGGGVLRLAQDEHDRKETDA